MLRELKLAGGGRRHRTVECKHSRTLGPSPPKRQLPGASPQTSPSCSHPPATHPGTARGSSAELVLLRRRALPPPPHATLLSQSPPPPRSAPGKAGRARRPPSTPRGRPLLPSRRACRPSRQRLRDGSAARRPPAAPGRRAASRRAGGGWDLRCHVRQTTKIVKASQG